MSCENIHTCRTLPSLLSSCASTIFLCTWATLHLDVPKDPDESWCASLWRRTWWTCIAVLAPEVIFFQAYDDWATGSLYLTRILEKHPKCGWTETHALFALMDGYQLVESNGSKKRFGRLELFFLIVDEQIDIPKMSVSEIHRRGKGDTVAKMIAIIQTIWFLLQTINRAVQRLPVTELELMTAAYVAMYLCIFFFWWNKPLDVRDPVYVRLREGKSKTKQPEQQKGERKARKSSAGDEKPLLQKDDEAKAADDTTPGQGSTATPVEHDVESQKAPASQIPALPVRVRLGAFLMYGHSDTMKPWRFLCRALLYFIGAGLFGAIHCIAWNWSKSRTTVAYLWRFSAVVVTVVPEIYTASSMASLSPTQYALPLLLSLLIYAVSRMSLLVLTFQALRSLPFEAYVTPSWTVYIPHFG